MNTELPKKTGVDVIIPIFNGEKYIIQAISSVEAQTYPPKKIIVVDDGSTDRTADRVLNFRGNIPIEYFKKENGGLSSARNAGLKRANNEYVSFLDADDEWYPNKLEEQAKKFEKTSFANLGVVYCQYEIIDENGQLTNKFYKFPIDPGVRGFIFEKILPNNKIAGSGSGVMIKRECFQKVGFFDETLSAAEDWDMWLRLAQFYEFDYVDKTLVKIRRHSKNMQNDEPHMYANLLHFYNKWLTNWPKNISIPRIWAVKILSKIIGRLPKTDYLNSYYRILINESRKKINEVIKRELKLFFCYKILSIPFIILMNLFKYY